ncbi:MAG TPA: NAD(P)/FAD-dependent oxidoreductase, partial [Pseudonocardiaceae bacterium]
LSTDPNPRWSLMYAKGDQLFDYTRRVADRHGLRPHLRFGCRVEEARWNTAEQRWIVTTTKEVYRARFLVSAAGLVADPCCPDVEGLAEFPGVWFHSAQWNHDHDLRGRKVAVIGAGASAIQFVPEIARQVAELHIIQRTPMWIMPKTDRLISARAQRRLARTPGLMAAERLLTYAILEAVSNGCRFQPLRRLFERRCRTHLDKQVLDPELRRKLTPDYEFMCKRPLISNDYLPALGRSNVTVHSGGLVEVRDSTVLAGDGTKAEVDTIILNTGFDIGITSPIARRIHGEDGVTLAKYWGDDPRAYKGMTIPRFPNLFLMQGPNASSAATSALIFGEAQAAYIANALCRFAKHDVATAEVREQSERNWTRWVRDVSVRTAYEVGGCRSYYLNRKGENVVMWPTWTMRYQLRTRRFDAQAYAMTTASTEVATPVRVAP